MNVILLISVYQQDLIEMSRKIEKEDIMTQNRRNKERPRKQNQLHFAFHCFFFLLITSHSKLSWGNGIGRKHSGN